MSLRGGYALGPKTDLGSLIFFSQHLLRDE